MAHMMTRMTRMTGWLDSHDSLARWLAVCQDPHHLRVSKRGRFLLGMMTNCYSFLSLILSIYYLEFDGMFGMILYYSYIYILDFPQDIIKTFTHSEWPI